MHGYVIGLRDQPPPGVADRQREIATGIEDLRIAGAKHGFAHFLHDGTEAVLNDGPRDGIDLGGHALAAQTGFSASGTGGVITRNTRSTRPEFEIACSTPGGRNIKSCLRTTWFWPAISISPSPSSTW